MGINMMVITCIVLNVRSDTKAYTSGAGLAGLLLNDPTERSDDHDTLTIFDPWKCGNLTLALDFTERAVVFWAVPWHGAALLVVLSYIRYQKPAKKLHWYSSEVSSAHKALEVCNSEPSSRSARVYEA